jgi:hypothetical protein
MGKGSPELLVWNLCSTNIYAPLSIITTISATVQHELRLPKKIFLQDSLSLATTHQLLTPNFLKSSNAPAIQLSLDCPSLLLPSGLDCPSLLLPSGLDSIILHGIPLLLILLMCPAHLSLPLLIVLIVCPSLANIKIQEHHEEGN